MKDLLGRRYQLVILILTLLLHALFFTTLFIAQLQQSNQQQPIILIEQEQQAPEQDWVAINNSLPATQFELSAAPTVQQQEVPQKQENSPPIAPQEEQKEISEPADSAIEEAIAAAEHLLAQTEIKEQEKSKDEPEHPVEKHDTTEIRHAELTASPQQNKLTFAQLAQGFVQHLEQAAMAVKSDQNGPASIEQLKRIHFCQKILGCLVNSYKINKGSLPHNKEIEPTRIQMTLNENGTIHSLTILQTSGNPAADRFLLHMFQDASSSFPPLPSSFEKPHHLPIFHVRQLEQFESTQYWYIDNKMG